ncbi:MAG: hypothetical protein ABIC40_05690, partial [bacterium]
FLSPYFAQGVGMRDMKISFIKHGYVLLILLAIFLPGTANAQHTPTWTTEKRDLLGEALSSVGFTRDDLGYEPKGYWARFPIVPYKLFWFDDLFAEPMRVYDWSRTMGNSVGRFLDPEMDFAHRTDGINSPDRIYHLLYNLAIVRRVNSFRNYGTNNVPRADAEEPILNALRSVYFADQKQLQLKSFGEEPAWPNPEKDAIRQLEGIDPEFQKIFADLILNALDAALWREKAVRNIPDDLKNDIFNMRDFAQTQGDGLVYFPQVDDTARLIDETSMAYAALKLGQATEDCRYALESWFVDHTDDIDFNFEAMTPFGRIVIAGPNDDVHKYDDCFILIDLGGNDTYLGPAGATPGPEIGISLCLDLSGNDSYECLSETYPTQGAGILGCGILYDASGNDTYIAKDIAQGSGFFGTGILYDGDGTDKYVMEETGQGSGSFGHGLCWDSGEGDDYYYMDGEGQGFGGCNGIGVLANWSGNETYIAEPSSEVFYRGDYHSEFNLNVSNCQGVGSGRRGDGTDGHSYAGGMGLIADMHGNDTYIAGNFSMGTGYWFGTGIMYEAEGDDTFTSPCYTQASGAHYCIGALIDEAGNDKHDITQTSTSGLSFARDWTISMLIDKSGDDFYKAYNTSLCYVNIRSNAFFLDLAGNDHYVIGTPQRMLGAADFQNYDQPSQYNPFASYCNSMSLFIDSGGEDIYEDWTREKSGEGENAVTTDLIVPSVRYGNNLRWEFPEYGTAQYGFNNFGFGWDLEAGDDSTIPDITWLDPKPVQPE